MGQDKMFILTKYMQIAKLKLRDSTHSQVLTFGREVSEL